MSLKLIVGLGNPGRKYAETRHNVGFWAMATLAEKFGVSGPRAKFQGETVEVRLAGEKGLLLTPHTFMNLSGSSVQLARDFYKLENDDLLIVCDDFNLPLAKLRFRPKGSAGGQKGLNDIIRRLGTQEFARLRIGIGPPPENWDVADYVLSRFSSGEGSEMKRCIERAVFGIEDWVAHGVEYCMNHYNSD